MSLNPFLGSTGTKQAFPARRRLTKKAANLAPDSLGATALFGGDLVISFPRTARPGRRAVALVAGLAALMLTAGAFVPAAAATATTDPAPPTISGNPTFVVDKPDGLTVDFAFTVDGSPTPTCNLSGSLPGQGALLGFDSALCALSGTVYAADAGDYPITVTAGNGAGPDAVLHTVLHISAPPALLGQALLASTGKPFSAQLQASGFPAPTFEVLSATFDMVGALPPGLVLDPDGLLHGTATTSGDYWPTVRLTNSAGSSESVLRISAGGNLTDVPPPTLTVGTAAGYSFNDGDPDQQSVLFSVTQGMLPPGLELEDFTGALTGIPQRSGDFPVTVTIDFGAGGERAGSRDYTLHVVDPGLPVAPTLEGTPASGTVGVTYSSPFTASGAPTCSAEGLPPGLTFDETTCVLAGVPTTAGSYDATFTASNGTAPDAVLRRTVVIGGPAWLHPGQELDVVRGRPVDVQLQVDGDPTVTLFDGASLPDGLSIDEHGHVTGTPTTLDYRRIDVHLQNALGESSGQFIVWVTGVAPTITSGAPSDITYGTPYRFPVVAHGDPAATLAVDGPLPNGITFDQETGELTGSATELGDFPVTVRAFNGYGDDSQDYTLHVTGTAPAIANTPAAASAGVPYSFTFDTGGSNPSPTFDLVSGTLPTGLTLYSNGIISGYSEEATAGSPVTVRAHNGAGPDAELTFTLAVNPGPPSFTSTPAETTSATVGVDYYGRYYAKGKPVAPTTSVTQGDLPPGLTINGSGELMGTPTTPGSYTFTVTASNGTQPDASVVRTIVVAGTPASIAGTPPTATTGTPYSFTYQLGGAPIPRTTLTGGVLPQGLTLDTVGRITGTPAVAGSFRISVEASNGTGTPTTIDSTLTVRPAAVLSLTGNPATGSVGEPYSFRFLTTGTPAPQVTVSAGSLPRGLSLSAAGLLSGIPSTAGTFRFDLRAANGVGTPVTRHVTMQIRPLPTVSIGDATTTEGASGSKALTFAVALSRSSTVPVTVHWATVDGTATAGSDFTAASGTVTFAPGKSSATVVVRVLGDRTKEPTETFVVRLSDPRSATITRTVGTGHILNDD